MDIMFSREKIRLQEFCAMIGNLAFPFVTEWRGAKHQVRDTGDGSSSVKGRLATFSPSMLARSHAFPVKLPAFSNLRERLDPLAQKSS